MTTNDMATNKSQEKIKYQEIIITLQKKTKSDKCQLKRRRKYLLKMIPWLKILSEHILQGINTINRSSRTEVFCKKAVLRNFTKFTRKHLCQSLFFNKVAGLRPATLLKRRLWHRCFPLSFARFLRTSFFIEHRLLLERSYIYLGVLNLLKTKNSFLWVCISNKVGNLKGLLLIFSNSDHAKILPKWAGFCRNQSMKYTVMYKKACLGQVKFWRLTKSKKMAINKSKGNN